MPDDRSTLEQQKTANSRQRLRIKELETENARHLADLIQVRSERDSFRNEAAKLRKDVVKLNKELADCRNKYDALHSAHEDSKRSNTVQTAVKVPKKPASKKRKIEALGNDPDAMIVDDPIDEARNSTRKRIGATVDIPGAVEFDPTTSMIRPKQTTRKTVSRKAPRFVTGTSSKPLA